MRKIMNSRPGVYDAKTGKRVGKIPKALSRGERKEVKKLIKGQSETKRTAWYQSFNDGTSPAKATGFLSVAGYAAQNSGITNNNTDILRLIPQVQQGTNDFDRIGNRISVNALTVQGAMRIGITNLNTYVPAQIRVVLYVLQHVSLKDYTNLYNLNNFNQLLDTQEGGTTAFIGVPINEGMRVADEYYKLCQKKVITLKYAGLSSMAEGPTNTVASISNCHTYFGTYNLNVTKHLPKVLKYPETQLDLSGNPTVNPVTLNAPTNSSLFMSMGFIDHAGVSSFAGVQVQTTQLQQTYVANLSYKDM